MCCTPEPLRKGGRVGVGGGYEDEEAEEERVGRWEGISSTTRSLPPIHLEDISAQIQRWLSVCVCVCVFLDLFVCVIVCVCIGLSLYFSPYS